MLKRVNKITALLVAATTVMSAIPVMASEKNLTPRLGELDGGITNAVAYKDGKYIFEGSKPDEDYGVYYNDGTKDTKLDDIDSLTDIKSRGLSSIVIPNGSKEEIFNLDDGKVATDGDTDDAATDARVKLENKLSKTNKYGKNVKIDPKDFIEVPSNSFFSDDNTWYQYAAKGNASYYNDINDDDIVIPTSKITVTFTGCWPSAGSKTMIAGQPFEEVWGLDSLKTKLESTNFTDYKVESATGSEASHLLTVVFTTTKDLGNVVPNGFIDSRFDGTSGIVTSCVAEPYKVEEPKSQITVNFTGCWPSAGSKTMIAGQPFEEVWGLDSLKTKLESTNFTDYKVESATGSEASHLLTVVFTTTKDLGNVVPNGFIDSRFDGTSGIVTSCVAEPYVASAPEEKTVIYYGYCDKDGNYIDCSKMANISVFNGESVVKVDDFNDKKVADDIKVKLGLPTIKKTLAQDQNYIYNLIEVPVTGAQDVNETKNEPDKVSKLDYIQKITKIQGDKDGGAYLPHDVKSYFLKQTLVWTGGDNWGYSVANNTFNGGTDNMKVQVNGNVLYVADSMVDSDGFKALCARIKLKTGVITALNGGKSLAQPMVFDDCTSNSDVIGDKNDTDKTVTKTDSGAWTTDYQGNVWTIHNGRIKMSGQGGTFEDKYKCSGNMNRLSVYDENNLIAWEDGGDTYVTVKDGQVTQHEVTKTGWQQAEDGSWHLYDLKGNDSKGWVTVKACSYYFDDKGAMKTGWADIDGKTYYFLASGVRATGWTKVGTEWYYFDASGVKQVSTTIDGYKLNSTGVRVN